MPNPAIRRHRTYAQGGGLTPAQQYAAIVASYSPLLYWKADESSGTNIVNYGSVGSANGTYSASDIAGQTTGPFGGLAARCVAADSNYLSLFTSALSANWPTAELTIGGWVRGYNGAWGDTTQNNILAIQSGTEFIWFLNTTTVNAWNFRYQTGGVLRLGTDVLSPAPGTAWNFLALTVSVSNARIRSYYNGTQVRQVANPATRTTSVTSAYLNGSGSPNPSSAFGDWDFAHWFVIGSELDSTAMTALYNGGPI